jgi:outer membrane biosynthesis protein TonB
MYPYYRRATTLTQEDIDAIRELYAASDTSPANPPPANPPDPTPQPPAGPTPPVNPTPTPPVNPTPTPPANPTPTPPVNPQPPATPPSQPPGVTDRVAPSLVITSPPTTSLLTYAASIVLRGTASDNVGVVAVTWSDSAGASGTAQGTTNWATGEVPLREGTNTITVRARDAAGNSGWRTVVITRRRR